MGKRTSLWSFLAFCWKFFDEVTLPHAWPIKVRREGKGELMVEWCWQSRNLLFLILASRAGWNRNEKRYHLVLLAE
jgi:hypothetical protein